MPNPTPWYADDEDRREHQYQAEIVNPRVLRYLDSSILAIMEALNTLKLCCAHMKKEGLETTDAYGVIYRAQLSLNQRYLKLKGQRRRIEQAVTEPDYLAEAKIRLEDFQNSLVPKDVIEAGKQEAPQVDLRDIYG